MHLVKHGCERDLDSHGGRVKLTDMSERWKER